MIKGGGPGPDGAIESTTDKPKAAEGTPILYTAGYKSFKAGQAVMIDGEDGQPQEVRIVGASGENFLVEGADGKEARKHFSEISEKPGHLAEAC
jgi:hypothetical protein